MNSRHVGAALALLFVGGLWACWCDLALIWDGAYQLAISLLDGHPFFYGTRFHSWVLWLPVTWLEKLNAPLSVLKFVYGAPYCLAPFFGVSLSWWVTRRTAPHLWLWAVFGSAIGTLPGQAFMINDSIWQMHVLWPVFLAVFLPVTRVQVGVIALLAVFQTSHPIGIAVCGAIAGAAVISAFWGQPARRGPLLAWAGWFALLTAVSVGKLILWPDSYAAQQAGLRHVLDAYRWGVEGLPLAGLLPMWVLAALLVAWPWPLTRPTVARPLVWLVVLLLVVLVSWRLRAEPSLADVLGRLALMGGVTVLVLLGRQVLGPRQRGVGIALLAVTALLWFIWSLDARIWGMAINYRRWVAPMSFIFFACAFFELWRGWRPSGTGLSTEQIHQRGQVSIALAFIYAMVLGTQSTGWSLQLHRLEDDVAAHPGPVLRPDDLRWTQGTVLEHWGLYTQVMLVQGRTPHALYLSREDLQRAQAEPPLVTLSAFTQVRAEPSPAQWFDWAPVLERLRALPQ